MDPLQKYVAHLFSNYGDSPRIKDLKEEVLSNLRAKLEDLVAEGIDPDTALAEAKASITSVTDLVEDGIKVRIWPFRMELTQTLLMYTLDRLDRIHTLGRNADRLICRIRSDLSIPGAGCALFHF